MARDTLWIAFTRMPPPEVRGVLLNLGWWWEPDKKRWEWRSASSAEPEVALKELMSRLEAVGFDLEAEGEWGVEERSERYEEALSAYMAERAREGGE